MAPQDVAETLISVVVPSHNDAGHIEQCIDSVLGQTVQPDEIIICDDASTDATRSIIAGLTRRYAGRIRALYHDTNVGCAANFNSGIFAAQGHYLSIVAADDYWHPRKLERELACLRQTGNRWAYSAVELYWEDGPHAGERVPFWGTKAGHGGELFEDILLRKVSPRNFLIERSLLLDVGGFDQAFGMYEDWDLKLRLAERHPAAFVADVGVTYRQHTKGISRSDPDRQLSEAAKVLRKNIGLIEKRFPKRTKAVRDAAWQSLLPGCRQAVPARSTWLDLAYSPRRLSQRGLGLAFIVGAVESEVLNNLVRHPDIVCVDRSGAQQEIWDLVPPGADAGEGKVEWMGAALYSVYRRLLHRSGKSRIVDTISANRENCAVVARIFPDALYIFGNRAAVVSVTDNLEIPAKVVVLDDPGKDAGPAHCFSKLCLAMDLPVCSLDSDRLVGESTLPATTTILLAEGEQLFNSGDMDAAEQRFHAALEIDAWNPDACNNLGVVRWQKNDAQGALQFLYKGLALDASHPDLLLNTIRVLIELQQLDEAETLCKQYVEVIPSASDVFGLVQAARQVPIRSLP